MATFTFGLQYPGGDLEEIDVAADSYGQARRQAEQIGRDGYQPGWTLVDLPPGGSGGLVTVIRL